MRGGEGGAARAQAAAPGSGVFRGFSSSGEEASLDKGIGLNPGSPLLLVQRCGSMIYKVRAGTNIGSWLVASPFGTGPQPALRTSRTPSVFESSSVTRSKTFPNSSLARLSSLPSLSRYSSSTGRSATLPIISSLMTSRCSL